MDPYIKRRLFDLQADVKLEQKKSNLIFELMQDLEHLKATKSTTLNVDKRFEKREPMTKDEVEQDLQRLKDEHLQMLNQLRTDRQNLQDRFNLYGLKVKTLDDFKKMTELWEEGFDHLYVQTIESTNSIKSLKMPNKYGMEVDFTFWDTDYEDLSDVQLEDELRYFEKQHSAQVRHDDRQVHIRSVISALKAEKGKREFEEEKRRGILRVREKRDTWQATKFRD